MLAVRRADLVRSRLLDSCRRYLATQNVPAVIAEESEYTAEPQYPEIQDLSFRARKERNTIAWHEEIRKLQTVEEKLIKINMPKYWGYKVVMLNDNQVPYNSLPALQHYTRTVLVELAEKEGEVLEAPSTEGHDTRMPVKASSAQLDSLVEAAQNRVQDSIEFAYDYYRHKYADSEAMEPAQQERNLAQAVLEQLNRELINILAADYPHLKEVEVDYNPRHEAFWFVGGINPPKNVVRAKEGHKWQKEMANDPVDRLMQYIGSPYLALRHKHQIPTWKSEAESTNRELAEQIPQFKYDPRTLGFVTDYRHGTNIPGFWPGTPNVFGMLSYQPRSLLHSLPSAYTPTDIQDTLHAQAIQTSYAWLLAQANYNGFNTFNDLTYPMNTQTIITNGRDFSFYEYQLNTLLVHSRHVNENPKVNFCRGTGELQLYQEVDEKGKCIGFNGEVLRKLIKCYTNIPSVQRSREELQPYLGQHVQYAAQYENEEKREFLDKTFKHMNSNRPRHLERPEIYLWEKFYKIDNKTRSLEPKRRFFELHINPWKRTMDQHAKEYIPKACRPEGPKSKKKFKQTYYP